MKADQVAEQAINALRSCKRAKQQDEINQPNSPLYVEW